MNIDEKIRDIANILSEFRRMDIIIYNRSIVKNQKILLLTTKEEEIIKVIYDLNDQDYIEKVTVDLLDLKHHEIGEKIAQREKGIVTYLGRILGDFEGILKKPRDAEIFIQNKTKKKINTEEIKNSIISEIHDIEQGVWDVFSKEIPNDLKNIVRKIIQAVAITVLVQTLQKIHKEEEKINVD